MLKRSLIVVALALAVTAFATVGMAGATKAPKAPKLCNQPRVEPNKIVIACADFGLLVEEIDWRYWGANKAKGSGVLVDAGGGSYLVNVTLQKVRARNCDGYHGKVFKTMKLNFPGALPPYAASVQKNRLFCIDK
ncbi:MAG TPA: hypothetical protein VFY99_11160 [Solirubrobacterales bacterium]